MFMQDTDLIDECIDMILELEGYDTDEIDNHEFQFPDINIEKKKTKKKLIPALIITMILISAISGTMTGLLEEFILTVKNNTNDFLETDISYIFFKNVTYYYDLESFYENEDYDIILSYIPKNYILQSIKCVYNENLIINIEYFDGEFYLYIAIINYSDNYSYNIIKGTDYSNIFLYHNNFFYNIECNNKILNEIIKSIELLGD